MRLGHSAGHVDTSLSLCPSGRERGPVFPGLPADAQNAPPSARPHLHSFLISFHKKYEVPPGVALPEAIPQLAQSLSERGQEGVEASGGHPMKKSACPLPSVLCRERQRQRQRPGWEGRPGGRLTEEHGGRCSEGMALRAGGWGGAVMGRRPQAAEWSSEPRAMATPMCRVCSQSWVPGRPPFLC